MNAFDFLTLAKKMLGNLDHWLGLASEHASAKGFDASVLVTSRLAPDMFPLARQVQSACDVAKFAAAYLTGQAAPPHPDTETTLGELRERIATCRAYLDTYQAADFANSNDAKVSPAWLGGKWFQGKDYLIEVAFPNFMFHITTAYAILRHNGVPLGKRHFLGALTLQG